MWLKTSTRLAKGSSKSAEENFPPMHPCFLFFMDWLWKLCTIILVKFQGIKLTTHHTPNTEKNREIFKKVDLNHTGSSVVRIHPWPRSSGTNVCPGWLSTRTRPDLAHGVAAMSRLMTKAPHRAVMIGTSIMKYLKGNPGLGLHYTANVPDDWGAHGQLKVQRTNLLLEVFCDIAYSARTGHRSIQGIVVCLGGQPICWQTSTQPFVTHSTAEAELVSYCEGLVIGKAAESLINELIDGRIDKKVIYGDNLAAIGLANCTTSASWRTRHLRIRASLLRESLEEFGHDDPRDRWFLHHVRGLDLVADGLTKPLLGAAFKRFLENLGMNMPFFKLKMLKSGRCNFEIFGQVNMSILVRLQPWVFFWVRRCWLKLKLLKFKENVMRRIHFG